MERIASFTVDHTKLQKGMYISRVDFGDIITYDVRMKTPNAEEALSPAAAHTLEHLFATFARNSEWKDAVVYVGPMGCLTGCYLITKGLPHVDAIRLVQQSMAFMRDFEGRIPGESAAECGNYRLQDLPAAKAVAADMAQVLDGWTEADLAYKVFL